jgi:hypothetical protein
MCCCAHDAYETLTHAHKQTHRRKQILTNIEAYRHQAQYDIDTYTHTHLTDAVIIIITVFFVVAFETLFQPLRLFLWRGGGSSRYSEYWPCCCLIISAAHTSVAESGQQWAILRMLITRNPCPCDDVHILRSLPMPFYLTTILYIFLVMKWKMHVFL